mgnify:CR=1 FL=1
MNLRDADHHGVQRMGVAAGDGLQRIHDLRGGHHGIHPHMRHRAMRALALHGDLENVEGGHHRPGPHGHLADIEAWPVVHAIDLLDREFLEQPVLDHDAAAAFILLRRLEDEIDRAVEILRLGEVLGGAQQHGGVAVMAAGMHLALMLRLVAEIVLLVHVQRIHVGTQADGPAGAVAARQLADDAGAGEAAMHLDAEGFRVFDPEPVARVRVAEVARIAPDRLAGGMENVFRNKKRDKVVVHGVAHDVESCSHDGHEYLELRLRRGS